MSALSSIVNIQITRQTTQVSQAGFGTALILGPNGNFVGEPIRAYHNLLEVGVDFLDTTPEYKMAAAYFGQEQKPEKLKIGFGTPVDPATMASVLGTISNSDDDWYALLLVENSDANVTSAAAWVENQNKIFVTRSNDAGIGTAGTTDIASTLSGLNYDRTAVIYHAGTGQYADAAWVGGRLPDLPGSSTWYAKTLKGITPDRITASALTHLNNKKANFYTSVAGVPITQNGVMVSGEFVDTIIGVDWLKARMAERIFGTLVRQKKLPFTQQGINMIISDVRTQLQIGIGQGLLADDPPFEVRAPAAAEVDPIDKLARTLRNVNFKAFLSGAIHKVEINGVVTV